MYYRRWASFRTRHVQRRGGNFMTFHDDRRNRARSYVSTYQLGSYVAKFRGSFFFDRFGRVRDSTVFRTSTHIRELRLSMGVDRALERGFVRFSCQYFPSRAHG